MFYVIIWISKLLGGISRLFGRGGGSALPGLFAEQADSKILEQLGKRLKAGSIVITGTNGKTTTTKMIQEIFESIQYKVVTNKSGSNLSRGVISTLIEQISWTGKFTAELGLFEVDEASMPAVCAALNPKAVVVLNLFRDQLDRYGELDTTAGFIGRAIEPLETQVYLNADDPLVASLARYSKNPVHYFGVEKAAHKLSHDLAADSDHCPFDGHPLDYSRNFFGHIGHYKCPNKDFKRPEPEVEIVDYASGKAFELKRGHQVVKLFLPLPGLYNAYNALAAVTLASGLGIDLERATRPLERVTAAYGRVERIEVEGRTVYLLLIKNPTGFNQVIQTFLNGEKPHSVMIAVNDNFADGRDVSWLWDVAVEEMVTRGSEPNLAVTKLKAKADAWQAKNPALKQALSQHQIIVSGLRATDMALRFKYAGTSVLMQSDLEVAFDQAIQAAQPGEIVYVLPTYTAMLQLRERIRSRGLVAGRWM